MPKRSKNVYIYIYILVLVLFFKMPWCFEVCFFNSFQFILFWMPVILTSSKESVVSSPSERAEYVVPMLLGGSPFQKKSTQGTCVQNGRSRLHLPLAPTKSSGLEGFAFSLACFGV